MEQSEFIDTDYARARVATENAFNTLRDMAKELGLQVQPVPGLMYLPTQKLTEDFKVACRAILLALTPSHSHVIDSNGVDHWEGESIL